MNLARLRSAAFAAIALAVLAASSGCAEKYSDLKVFVRAHETNVAGTAYRLDPPDVIRIVSPTSPEVDGEVQRIHADGKISLKLIGDVYVAGMTPDEIGAKITDLLKKYYESPRVHVRVASYESKSVYVFGQVGAVGPHPFTGRDTVLDVLARSSMNFLSWGAKVKVIRPSPDPNESHEIVVNVDKMMQSGDLSDNILLQEGDMVYVPPTPSGWVGLRVHEALFPFSPILSAYQMPNQFRDTTYDYRHNERKYYYEQRQKNDNDDSNWRRLLSN